MILKAIHRSGWLDVGAQEQLEKEKFNFRRCLLPGQVITVPDQYRGLRNIDSAISAGLLLVVSYDSSPGSLVVNAELGQQFFGSSSSSSSASGSSSQSSQSPGGGFPIPEFYAMDATGNTIKIRLIQNDVGFYAMDAGGNTIKVDIPQVGFVTPSPQQNPTPAPDSSSSSSSELMTSSSSSTGDFRAWAWVKYSPCSTNGINAPGFQVLSYSSGQQDLTSGSSNPLNVVFSPSESVVIQGMGINFSRGKIPRAYAVSLSIGGSVTSLSSDSGSFAKSVMVDGTFVLNPGDTVTLFADIDDSVRSSSSSSSSSMSSNY